MEPDIFVQSTVNRAALMRFRKGLCKKKKTVYDGGTMSTRRWHGQCDDTTATLTSPPAPENAGTQVSLEELSERVLSPPPAGLRRGAPDAAAAYSDAEVSQAGAPGRG